MSDWRCPNCILAASWRRPDIIQKHQHVSRGSPEHLHVRQTSTWCSKRTGKQQTEQPNVQTRQVCNATSCSSQTSVVAQRNLRLFLMRPCQQGRRFPCALHTFLCLVLLPASPFIWGAGKGVESYFGVPGTATAKQDGQTIIGRPDKYLGG